MCISFGQKDFRYNDILKNDDRWTELIRLAQTMKPNSYRVNMWQKAVLFTSGTHPEVREAQFSWIEKKKDHKTWPVFNVRVEGGWNNKENDRNYSGPFHIYKNPYVKNLIQFQRCIVPCDHFIEQPEEKQLKNKYLIRKANQQPIHLGGIYKETLKEDTGEVASSFCLMTTPPTEATLAARHHRSPLVIEDEEVFTFLNPKLTAKELNAFFRKNNSSGFEVFEVDPDITSRKEKYENDDPKWVEAKSEAVLIN